MTKNNKYNLIFIGTPDFSVPTLQALISDERFSVSTVITAPDAKVGRKQIVTAPPVKVIAEKNNIPVLQPKNIKSLPLALREGGLGVKVDAIVTIAYGQIIPQEILDIPKFGCLNLHASLLPKYRGASPIQSAILNNEKETGVTLMKMDKGMDTGDIITQEKISIDSRETGESLHNKLSELSANVLKKYLVDYLEEKLKPVAQDNSQATIAKKLTRDSGKIDWNKSAEEVECMVRAYYPWPGTHTSWNNKTLKIIKVDLLKQKNHQTGEIFLENNQLAIQCKTNALLINQLQLEGKKVMTAKEFLTGNKDIVGYILK